ncbi:MAG: hypothetical protein Kow0031_12700 [Anaerolineae bacterium]
MDNQLPSNGPVSTRNLWLRLSIPVVLALALTTLILLVPAWAAPPYSTGDNSSNPLTRWLAGFIVQAQTGLTITKSADPVGTVDQGGLITYTLRVTNNSGSNINFLGVTDPLPTNTSCDPAYNSSISPVFDSSGGLWTGACTGGKASWDYVNIASSNPGGSFSPGEAVTLTFRVRVDKPLRNLKDVISNEDYTVRSSPPDTVITGTTVITQLVLAPEWAITKTANPADTVQPGQNITYTITVTNIGSLPTEGPFTVTETLPANANFVSASLPVTQSGSNLTWVRSGLAAGQAISFTVVASITSPLANGTKIINSNYRVSGGMVYTDAVGQPVTVTVDSPVTLTVRKTATDTVQAGDLLTYTITITNDAASRGAAVGLVFTDAIPANTQYVGHGFSGSTTGGVSGSGPVVTWTLSSLAIGQTADLTLTVRVQSPLTNGTVITNNRYGPAISNTLFVDPPAAVTTTVNSAPVITFSKTVTPNSVVRGQPVTYTITITNSGNETAVNLPFTDAVRAPDFNPGQVTWSQTITGKNLAGTPGVVNYTLVMTAGSTPGQFGNFLTTTVRGADIVVGPVATVTVRGAVDLQITKARLGSGTVVRGNQITYTLTLTNAGPETADARITDTFTNATYASHTIDSTRFPGATCSGSGPLACTVPALTGTTTITVVLNTDSSISGTITNTAVITTGIANQGDTNPLNNRATITTPVRYPLANLQISKARLGSGELLAGDSITYTLTITNAAGSDTVDAVVTDTFTSAGGGTVTLGSVLPTPACSGSGPVVCRFDDFTGTQTITVVLNSSTSFSGTITNTAEISFSASIVAVDTDPGDNSDTVTTTVRLPRADLSLSKARLGSGPVIAGGLITYTITLTNPPGSDIVDAVLTDTFTGTATVANTSPGGLCSGSGPIVCNVDAFTNTQTITVVLQTGNSFSGTLTNTARVAVAVSAVDPPGNNSDTVTTTVRQLSADLQIAKTGPGFATAGDPITYTVVITNPGDPVDVVVTDTFDYGSYQSATPSPGSGGSCSGSGPIACTFSNFAGSAVITVVLNTANVSSDNTLVNTATITTPLPNAIDPNPNNNSDYATTIVQRRRADLQMEKTLVGSSPVQAGQQITYTLRITNTGPDVVGATLNDTATPFLGVTGIRISSPTGWTCSTGINTISCNNPQLGLTSQTFTVVLTTSATFTGTITNKAGVDPASPAFDPSPDDNNAEVKVDVVLNLSPVLTITKTASPAGGNVSPGGTIRYTLSVTNTGNGSASGVVITDSLSAVGGVAYVSGSGSSSSGSSFNHSGGLVTVSAASLGAGKVLTATWQVTVTASASGTALSNYANAASAATPVITSNVVAHTVITVPPAGPVFLPIISKNCCYPNLVITNFQVNTSVNPPAVTVVVSNIGLGSTGSGFWVDLYVNPSPLPASLLNDANPGDRRWQRLRTNVDQGIAWEITTPLAPGGSITLTQTSPQVNPIQTKWTGLSGGPHNFYTFADSFDADNNRYVEINEGSDANELDNQSGPVSSLVAGADKVDSAAQPAETYPPRRDAGQ